MPNNDQLWIPGLEPAEEGIDEYHEGRPSNNKDYFDAATLPDAPEHQQHAHGSKTFILYVIFPDWESLQEGVFLLSGRKALAKRAFQATVSSEAIHYKTKEKLLDFWRRLFKSDCVKEENKNGKE